MTRAIALSLILLGTSWFLAPVVSTADAQEMGVISGSVRFIGDVPTPQKFPIDKDNDVCGTGFREWVDVKVGAEQSLGNVVVCLQSEGGGPVFEMPEAGYFKLDQKGCAFLPEIMLVPRGEKLRITNKDPIIHNIHTYERLDRIRRDLFSFAQPERGHRRTETMEPERSDTVELTCDVHAFMHGWIYVSDGSPCVVSEDGSFKISEVPPGEHTVTVWHSTLGEQEMDVTLDGAGDLAVEFVYGGEEEDDYDYEYDEEYDEEAADLEAGDMEAGDLEVGDSESTDAEIEGAEVGEGDAAEAGGQPTEGAADEAEATASQADSAATTGEAESTESEGASI